MNNIKVSVVCLAYNHENYIEQCLNGFINQIADFEFEVIIHDDASTDNTKQIIEEYVNKYPNIIKPIYQKENKYQKGIPIHKEYFLPIVKGKYIAFCEGDDFWTDPYKLQKQVDIMDENPNCHFCVHKVKTCKEDGSYNKLTYPRNKYPNNINSYDFIKTISMHWEFHYSSYFVRYEDYVSYLTDDIDFKKNSPIGDLCMMMYYGNLGDIIYIDETMSCYRLFSKNSYTNKFKKSNENNQIEYYNKMISVWEKYNIYTEYKYDKIVKLCIENYNYNILKTKKNFKNIIKECPNIFRMQSIRKKIILILVVYIPGFAKIYTKCKEL